MSLQATMAKFPQWVEQMNDTARRSLLSAESASSVDRGVYVAVFFLRSSRHITVGRLGRLFFDAGLYFCVRYLL